MTTENAHTSAIQSKKVIGTNVSDMAGTKIGVIEDIVFDKKTGRIIFAVVGFGGVMGMGEKFHPVPWSTLDYDVKQQSYMVSLTKEQLKSAPADSIEELTRNNGMTYRDLAHEYYKAPRTW